LENVLVAAGERGVGTFDGSDICVDVEIKTIRQEPGMCCCWGVAPKAE